MSTAEVSTEVLQLGTHTFTSRLIVGTGKYADYDTMRESLVRSGTECITVAVRRERLYRRGRQQPARLHRHQPLHAACPTRPAASPRTMRSASPSWAASCLLGLENPGADWVKLEVLADKRTLLPDPIATLEATERLVADGFQVLCYSTDDPIIARRLKEAGATSVMPAGSPIGSGQGVLNPNNIRICLEYLKEDDPDYPVIVDAGVGTASDVTIAMELGVDGVLLEHRHRPRQGPAPHGRRNAPRHRSRPARLSLRPHPEAALRDGEQPGGRRDFAESPK